MFSAGTKREGMGGALRETLAERSRRPPASNFKGAGNLGARVHLRNDRAAPVQSK